MTSSFFVIVIGTLAGLYLLKRLSLVSQSSARQHLAQGALIIDVRSPEEFAGGHVQGALNIPLGELKRALPGRVKNKKQVLLLHCLSGGRSGVAQLQLKALGYAHVFNLGSYRRAKHIVEG